MTYIIIFTSIITLIVLPNKKVGLKISICLLFIIWGLQYNMVQDWDMNLSRWNSVNHKEAIFRDVEPLLAYLMSLSKSLTFFGWLMLCAIIELGTIYYFTTRYVPPRYYWLVIFVLMIRIDYGLLLINSNRQTLSVILTMYAVLVLLNSHKTSALTIKGIPILHIIVSSIIIYAATKIHSAAFFAFIIIPIFLCVTLVKGNYKLPIFIICNILFIGRFIFDVTSLEPILTTQLNQSNITGFDHYLELFDTSSKVYSFIDQPIYIVIMNLTIFFYPKMNFNLKFFSALTICGIILGGYMMGNLYRITQYLYIYLIFIIPSIVYYWSQTGNQFLKRIRIPLYCIMLSYCLYSFNKNLQGNYYKKWNNFTTIFEAPKWL